MRYFGAVSPTLYQHILMQYAHGGHHAMNSAEHADADMVGMHMNARTEESN